MKSPIKIELPRPDSGGNFVYVLLSTFNGERFLPELLESLANQVYPNIRVLVRDDGSSDKTRDIVQCFASSHANFWVVPGENIGAVASFMALLEMVRDHHGYFSFCDQDDIWHPEKVARAVARLQSSTDPDRALYFSRFELVGPDAETLGWSDVPAHISFNNSIVENIVTGATAVFGSRLRDLMLLAKPEYMVWHDWWLYLLGAAFGQVLYDQEPTMQSRRHGKNQTDMRMRSHENFRAKAKALVRVLKRKRKVLPFQQAAGFGEVYAALLSEDRRELLKWMGRLHSERRLQDRIKFACSREIELNDRIDSIGLRTLVLLGCRV